MLLFSRHLGGGFLSAVLLVAESLNIGYSVHRSFWSERAWSVRNEASEENLGHEEIRVLNYYPDHQEPSRRPRKRSVVE